MIERSINAIVNKTKGRREKYKIRCAHTSDSLYKCRGFGECPVKHFTKLNTAHRGTADLAHVLDLKTVRELMQKKRT